MDGWISIHGLIMNGCKEGRNGRILQPWPRGPAKLPNLQIWTCTRPCKPYPKGNLSAMRCLEARLLAVVVVVSLTHCHDMIRLRYLWLCGAAKCGCSARGLGVWCGPGCSKPLPKFSGSMIHSRENNKKKKCPTIVACLTPAANSGMEPRKLESKQNKGKAKGSWPRKRSWTREF